MKATEYDWTTRTKSKTPQYEIAFQAGRKIKSFLGLPGGHCADIKYAYKQQAITPYTTLTCVEKDAQVTFEIREYLKTIPNTSFLHQGELHDLNQKGQKYDCAFIDLFGGLTPKLLNWFRDCLAGMMEKDAHFTIVVNEKWRNNDLVPACLPLMKNCKLGLAHLRECNDVFDLPLYAIECLATNLWLINYFGFPGRELTVRGVAETQEEAKSNKMLCIGLSVGETTKQEKLPESATKLLRHFPNLAD